MSSSDDLLREIAALRDRMSRLSAASLRISASLDLDTVLREIVESARVLTDAKCGVITMIDDAARPHGFVSTGLTPDARERMQSWSDGPRLFAHFRDLSGPVRLPDAATYARSLGFAVDVIPQGAFQATPMRHRGVPVGYFFLAREESGREFTDEDEEILVMFAWQAATAIANARAYEEQRRARTDMEALVDTSPVGVVVFDARTGDPVSINREARRIVEGLCAAGQSVEDLRDLLSIRRADGSEVSLREMPLAQLMSSGETVLAEEVTLSVPDGRSIKTLINATPIRSADGEVESFVVTMQDLAPLDELERSRTEFLSLVSHELRAPLTSIKGAAATVLGASTALDRAEFQEFFRIIDEQADHMRGLISDLLDAGRIETGTLSVAPEPTDVSSLVDRARNTFVSGSGRHDVSIDLPLDLPRVLADRQRIVQVLNNLLSNAARHAPESSPIRVSAVRDGLHVAISVTDEGRGVPSDQLPQLFRKHARFGNEDRHRGNWTGPGHLQGTRGGPRRPHPGRKRRNGAGHANYLHDSRGLGCRGHRRSSGARACVRERAGATSRARRGR